MVSLTPVVSPCGFPQNPERFASRLKAVDGLTVRGNVAQSHAQKLALIGAHIKYAVGWA